MIDRDAAEAAVRRAMQTDHATAVALVQVWASDVKGPPVPDAAADAIAADLRCAMSNGWWWDAMTEVREHDPDAERARRIAAALRLLQRDLPPYIEAWRMSTPPVPLELTVALFPVVNSHQRLIDAAQPRGRGRAPSQERDVAAHFSRRVREAWGDSGDQGRADAFAGLAVAWLTGRPAPSDSAVARGRTRREKRAGT